MPPFTVCGCHAEVPLMSSAQARWRMTFTSRVYHVISWSWRTSSNILWESSSALSCTLPCSLIHICTRAYNLELPPGVQTWLDSWSCFEFWTDSHFVDCYRSGPHDFACPNFSNGNIKPLPDDSLSPCAFSARYHRSVGLLSHSGLMHQTSLMSR